jgi:hypothetical protein
VFSFTASGKPFVVQNWLGELIYFWTYSSGGYPLLVFLGTAITVGGFLLIYQLCLRASGNVRVAAFVGFLAALGNYGFLRPQTYSFLLFAAFYWVLVEYRERGKDRLWILPLLMALWVNLHGAFILGLALVGLYIACESSRRFVAPDRTDALTVAQIRKLAVVLLLCGLATLLNPEGLKLYDYVRTVVLDPGSQKLVAEWRPPRINDFLGFLLFYCPFLLTVAAFVRARVKPDFTELSLFLIFGVLGLISIRNAAWFSTVTYPMLARYLSLMDLKPFQGLRRYAFIDRMFDREETAEEQSRAHARINAVMLVGAFFLVAMQSPWIRPAMAAKSLLAEQTPIGMADFIEKKGITGRLFHPQEFGDYLIWRLWPQQKTFVDGRVHLFSLDFLNDYERGIEDPVATGILDRWNIQYVALRKLPADVDLKAMRSVEGQGWTKVFEDNVAVLYERPGLLRGN